jgi:hypothetical protein
MIWKNIFSFKYFVPGFTIVLGLVMVTAALVRLVETESYMRRAEYTTGTVIEAEHGVLIVSATITVEYMDEEGVTRTSTFEPGKERTPLKKGDLVNLFYDPADKSSIFIGNPRTRRHPVSAIYFILGAGLIIFTLRRWRENAGWN